jgi:hypothetical protein
MCFLRNDTVKIIAAGFIVLTLISIPMFWCRCISETSLDEIMPGRAREINIMPSGLMPDDIENDPCDNFFHSQITASGRFDPVKALGIPDYFLDRQPGGRLSSVISHNYEDSRNNHVYYFDHISGLIIYRGIQVRRLPDKSTELEHSNYYIGPDGISEISGEELGRFIDPITHRAQLIFDRKLRRFFSVDFNKMKVTAGPEIQADDKHNPIQIKYLEKNAYVDFPRLHINITPPGKRITVPDEKDPNKTKQQMKYITTIATYMNPYALVLDESGRIDLLDKETLRFAGPAGHLILPESLYKSHAIQYASPDDLSVYKIESVAIGKDSKDLEHRGICVATISREGSAMALAVFDKNAKLIRIKHSKITDEHPYRDKHTAKSIYFDRPWAPFWTIVKYSIENIHPPILCITSFLTANSIEATTGYRAMFLLPNSFTAMKARGNDEKPLIRFIEALILLAPGIALALFFAWRINRDALRIGLSENTRLCWILAAAAFGLVAYITYRLTKPNITLVTCSNCGKQRRPDMNKCHRCSAKWLIPELTPPTWRVIDQ